MPSGHAQCCTVPQEAETAVPEAVKTGPSPRRGAEHGRPAGAEVPARPCARSIMTDTIAVRGFAGTTPEHRTPSSGTEVTTLRLGSTPRWRNAHTGEWSSGSTNWYTIAAFGRLAQNVAESISKGDPIVVVGRPKVRQWENDDGVRGTDMEINAQSLAHDLNYGRTDFTKISSAISRAE